MKTLVKQIVPYTCTGTTLMLLISAIYNLLHHYDSSYYIKWLIIIGGMFSIYVIEFGVLCRIDFKNGTIYYILVYMLWYFGFGIMIFCTHWMEWNIQNALHYTIVMAGCNILMSWYGRMRTKVLADEINALLEKGEK